MDFLFRILLDFDMWQVDLKNKTAIHSSGLLEGEDGAHFGEWQNANDISPPPDPQSLPRLMRDAGEAYINALSSET